MEITWYLKRETTPKIDKERRNMGAIKENFDEKFHGKRYLMLLSRYLALR